jgi:hypothetical protein
MYKKVVIAKNYQISSSISVFCMSLLNSIIQGNFMITSNFLIYNQLIGQLSYINISMGV